MISSIYRGNDGQRAEWRSPTSQATSLGTLIGSKSPIHRALLRGAEITLNPVGLYPRLAPVNGPNGKSTDCP